MRVNQDNVFECLHRKSIFHLETGESIIGVMSHYENEGIIHIESDGKKVMFPLGMIHSCVFVDPNLFSSRTRLSLVQKSQLPPISNITCKKLIILGAGASSDFGASGAGTIPLTDAIFQTHDANFRGAMKIRPQALTAISNGQSLEEYFEVEWSEILRRGDIDMLHNVINAQFYIQKLFMELSIRTKGIYPNNYTKLLWHVKNYLRRLDWKENVSIVTFNYDTLLENSLNHIFEYQYNSQEDYIIQGLNPSNAVLKPVMLFKPHGSWNWVHRFKTPFIANSDAINNYHEITKAIYEHKLTYADLLFSIAPELKDSDVLLHEIPSIVRDTFHVIGNENINFPFYPNLLIPFKEKDQSLMPLLHENLLRWKLKDVEEILVVGWKGTEKHFNQDYLGKYLGSKELKVIYVSPNTQSTEKNLKPHLPNAEFIWLKGTFGGYLNEIASNNESKFNIFRNNSVTV